MKEETRKKIIREINKDLLDKDLLSVKKDKLESLSQSPIILNYLYLIDEINRLQEKQNLFHGEKSNMIAYEFEKELSKDCKHNIWIYDGTYINQLGYNPFIEDPRCDLKCNKECNSENCDIFLYNKYICLECGYEYRSKNWEEFEQNHFVLKNKNSEKSVDEYRKMYFELLYEYDENTSQELFFEEFNSKKEKSKQKVLK